MIKVIYNPEVVTYRELVDFFWSTHDASRSDGVWPDFGPQYRSILLYQNDAERKAIEASSTEHEARTGQLIATEIKALDIFHPAELYHQDYAEKNPKDRYVRSIIGPKMKKLGPRQISRARERFPAMRSDHEVLIEIVGYFIIKLQIFTNPKS